MNNKEKLIELLKTVPVIKDDLEELKWGVWLKENRWAVYQHMWANKLFMPWHWIITTTKDEILKMQVIPKLEQRHLLLYSQYKHLYLSISDDWGICNTNRNEIEHREEEVWIEVDFLNSFDNQSEEFYWELFNFLKKFWLS